MWGPAVAPRHVSHAVQCWDHAVSYVQEALRREDSFRVRRLGLGPHSEKRAEFAMLGHDFWAG